MNLISTYIGLGITVIINAVVIAFTFGRLKEKVSGIAALLIEVKADIKNNNEQTNQNTTDIVQVKGEIDGMKGVCEERHKWTGADRRAVNG